MSTTEARFNANWSDLSHFSPTSLRNIHQNFYLSIAHGTSLHLIWSPLRWQNRCMSSFPCWINFLAAQETWSTRGATDIEQGQSLWGRLGLGRWGLSMRETLEKHCPCNHCNAVRKQNGKPTINQPNLRYLTIQIQDPHPDFSWIFIPFSDAWAVILLSEPRRET